ncbi:MAG: DUF4276 family protein [Desulfamplus sp.]|nr:DUF4276 family protein [Desulfamplus sp.]
MKYLVFLLEEPSAKEMLKGILPKIISPEITIKYIIFEGKQDLEKQIINKLNYWKIAETYFIVMRDQDSADCKDVKQNLINKIKQTKKADQCIVRIACHELESFYLGDLEAVENGLKMKNISKLQNNKKFKNPDRLANAAQELKKLTSLNYQKISGSRAIAPFLNISGENKSKSFNVLLNGIRTLLNNKAES